EHARQILVATDARHPRKVRDDVDVARGEQREASREAETEETDAMAIYSIGPRGEPPHAFGDPIDVVRRNAVLGKIGELGRENDADRQGPPPTSHDRKRSARPSFALHACVKGAAPSARPCN